MNAATLRLDRRALLGLGIGAGTVAAAVALWPSLRVGAGVDIPALLADVCDRTLPATETPGAKEAKVPAFVVAALAAGIGGASGDELQTLATELGEDYLALADPKREEQLRDHDAAAFATNPPNGAWPLVKKLIVLGYYTSEIGGSQELAYNLDPGQWQADLPVEASKRAWSNDWLSIFL